jgi:hypothetical protein
MSSLQQQQQQQQHLLLATMIHGVLCTHSEQLDGSHVTGLQAKAAAALAALAFYHISTLIKKKTYHKPSKGTSA